MWNVSTDIWTLSCPKNDFISFFRKCFCALGLRLLLGLGLGLELAEIRLYTFSVKRPFGQVYWIRFNQLLVLIF